MNNNDIVQITFVKNFFVHKMRNHNYGKSFEFQFYEVIIMSVQLVGSAHNGGNVSILTS